MKLIIEIDEDVYKKIVADKYAIYDKMFYSIKNGTPIPDNATNGQVLDKIRDEIVEEQSCWREDADAEWHECRRILRIIDKYRK